MEVVMPNIGDFLYHSTFRNRLRSIRHFGLGAKQHKSWKISENNVVYLSKNPEIAFSYCEAAEDVSDSVYESGIIVLAIPLNCIDYSLLALDSNIVGTSTEYTYRGIIEPNNCFVVTRKKGLVGGLTSIKRVPPYE